MAAIAHRRPRNPFTQSRTLGEIQSTFAAPFAAAPPTLKAIYTDLPAGDAGVKKTILVMQSYANGGEGALNPQIYALARQITGNVPSRDYMGELGALLEWVRQYVKFRGEPDETVQTPLVTLQLRAGDCDDMSTLLAALVRSLGYHYQFRTVAADSSAPSEFSHVYLEAQDKGSGQWIALDATVPYATAGWAPAGVTRSKSWGLNGLADGMLPVVGGSIPASTAGGWEGTFQNIIQTFASDIAPSIATRIAGQNASTFQFSGPGGVSASGGLSIGWLLVLGVGGFLLIKELSSR